MEGQALKQWEELPPARPLELERAGPPPPPGVRERFSRSRLRPGSDFTPGPSSYFPLSRPGPRACVRSADAFPAPSRLLGLEDSSCTRLCPCWGVAAGCAPPFFPVQSISVPVFTPPLSPARPAERVAFLPLRPTTPGSQVGAGVGQSLWDAKHQTSQAWGFRP